VLSALLAQFELGPESDDANPSKASHSQVAPCPKVIRLEDGSFCLQEDRESRPCSYTTTAECDYCLKTITLHIEMPEYTRGSWLKEAQRLALLEHLRTDHIRKST
jgi:hypothetical protein